MQLKKQIKKAAFRATLASGEPYCNDCRRRLNGRRDCNNKKCPEVRRQKAARLAD